MWSITQTPDGGLNIIVEDETVAQVAQRLLCWSNHDKRIEYVFGAPIQYFHVPAAVCREGNYGDLVLKEGGPALPCDTGSRPLFVVMPLEQVAGIDPNNCSTTVPAPTGLVVVGEPTEHSIQVAWQYQGPPDAGGFRVAYRPQATSNNDVAEWQFLTPFHLPAYTRTATLRGLAAGTAYEIAVMALDRRNWVGVASPLSTPLVVTTPGVPPTPADPDLCGPPAPGIVLGVSEDTSDTTRMTVSLLATADGEVTVDWGDGSATETNPGDGTTSSTHQYAAAGNYTITVTETATGRTASKVVTVPFTATLPLTITATEDTSDSTRMTATVTANNQGEGEVTVDFGDDSPVQTNAGDGTATTSHEYLSAGTYTIKVTDSDDPARTASESVTVPYAGARAAAARGGPRAPRNAR